MQPKVSFMSVVTFCACLFNIDVAEVNRLRLFNFGEPLLHPNPAELVDHLRGWKAKHVELSTNAQCAVDERLTDLLKLNVVTDFIVSCDGNGTAEDYERLRPPAKWDRLIEFLRKTKELRDRYCPKMTLVTRTIVEDSKCHVRWREVLHPLGWLCKCRSMRPLPGSEYAESQHPSVPSGACSYTKGKFLYVDVDGTVVPCCAHPHAADWGNLTTTKYREIRRGAVRHQMMLQMTRDRKSMPICGRCPL
jgi:radical SAM protein with 4Fe4S-binding SPASM domain